MIRLEFNSTLCGYYPEIDAVQLIGFRVNETTRCIMAASKTNNNDQTDKFLSQAIANVELTDESDVEGYFSTVLVSTDLHCQGSSCRSPLSPIGDNFKK